MAHEFPWQGLEQGHTLPELDQPVNTLQVLEPVTVASPLPDACDAAYLDWLKGPWSSEVPTSAELFRAGWLAAHEWRRRQPMPWGELLDDPEYDVDHCPFAPPDPDDIPF